RCACSRSLRVRARVGVSSENTPSPQPSPASGRGGQAAAVVTGGSAGIGLAICEQLLADGLDVVSLARRPCPIAHPKLHSVEVDLLDRAATAEVARSVVERFDVTTIVHNAGVIRPALLADVQLED